MKRAISLLLSITMLLSVLAGLDITAFASTLTGKCGDNVTYTYDTSTGKVVISGTGKMFNYVFYDNDSDIKPANISPFYRNKNIKSVIIEDGVTSVGIYAFDGCTELKSTTISDSVTEICDNAFISCKKLSITVPSSVVSIGVGALYRVKEIIVDEKNNYYSSLDGVLYNKDKTELIQFPYCTIKEFTIPNSVTSIRKKAFTGCDSLESIIIPNSFTSISEYAFSGCDSLRSITLPESVVSIERSAFGYCENLTDVYYGGNIEQKNEIQIDIDGGEYEGNDYLLKAKWHYAKACNHKVVDGKCEYCGVYTGKCGDNATYVFDPNSGEVVISGTGDMYDYDDSNYQFPFTLNEKTKSVVIEDGITSVGSYAFGGCTELANVSIPNSVISIGEGAFAACWNIMCLEIPNSVTSIGTTAFAGVKNVIVDENNSSYISVDGALYDKDKTRLMHFYSTDENAQFVVPDSVTLIELGAFYNCTGLKKITIPDSVTSIGNYAFYGCSGLTSIAIPDGVTSINEGTFVECSGLTEINIPNSVTSIGDYAFNGCSGLTSIIIPDGVTSISDGTFMDCTGLTKITIPDGVTSIGNSAFRGCSGLTSIVIPDGVTSIGSSAFRGCSGLTSVTIPESIVSIERYAFGDCENLTDVYYGGDIEQKNKIQIDIEDGGNDYLLKAKWHCAKVCKNHKVVNGQCEYCGKYYEGKCGNNVTYTYDESTGEVIFSGTGDMYGSDELDKKFPFAENVNTKSVVIGDGITSISDGAFKGCSGLTEITIPSSITSIGSNAFNGCSGLTSIAIPDGITSINDGTFKGCSGLTEITIPDGVASIGDSAFDGCSRLTSIAIPDGVTSIGNSAFSGCSGLTNINIPDNVVSIGDSAFDSCCSLTSISIPDGILSLGYGTFSYCEELKSITIPESMTSIDQFVFDGCTNLTDVYYGGNKEQKNKIQIDYGNEDFENATWHYAKPCDTHNFVDNVCSYCGADRFNMDAYNVALKELEEEANKNYAYESNSVSKAKDIAAQAKKSAKTAQSQAEVDEIVSELLTAKSNLVRAEFTLKFIIVSSDDSKTVETKAVSYGDVITLDSKTDKVEKWVVKTAAGTFKVNANSRTYDYVVTSDSEISVYVDNNLDKPSASYSKVTFIGHNNSVVEIKYIESGKTIDTSLVDVPNISFYNTVGWDQSTVTGSDGNDFIVRAVYRPDDSINKCKVYFDNEFVSEFDYDSLVNLSDYIKSSDALYGIYDSNGKLLTSFTGTSFYAPHNTAIYIKPVTKDEPTTALTGSYIDGTKYCFNSKFYLPSDATLVEAGIVIELSKGNKTTDPIYFRANNISSINEYTVKVNCSSYIGSEATLKAKSYLVYKTSDGTVKTLISDQDITNIL